MITITTETKRFTLKTDSDRSDKLFNEIVRHLIGLAPDGSLVFDEWICPCCNSRYEVDYDEYEYCPNCGQKIAWEERSKNEIN